MATNKFLVIFCCGLEPFVEAEIKQKVNPSKITVFQGSVVFETPLPVAKVIELRSVDIILSFVAQVDLPLDASAIEKLKFMARDLPDWENGYLLWRENRNRLALRMTPDIRSQNGNLENTGGNLQRDNSQHGNLPNNNSANDNLPNNNLPNDNLPNDTLPSNNLPSNNLPNDNLPNANLQNDTLQNSNLQSDNNLQNISQINAKLVNIPVGGDEIKFRCTCQRKGTHAYTSPEIAASLGSSVNDTFQWKVDLKGYNLEVFADVREERMLVGIVLSDHKKFMLQDYAEHGTTKLRTSVANALGRISNIQPGDIVVDPCCGMGTIPIECSWIWPEATYMGGDIDDDTARKAKANVDHTRTNVDIFHWSARKLPFKAESIDKFISDLPFGRRSGTHKGNSRLYAWLFKEMTRVLKLNGTATLLTLERALVESLLNSYKNFQVIDLHTIDMDGLSPRLYVLKKIANRNENPDPKK